VLRGSTTATDDRLVAVADRQRRRRLELVGKRSELGHRHLLEPRPDRARQLDEPEAERVAAVGRPAHEALLEKRGGQPVDARAVRLEIGRELGHRAAVGFFRKGTQDAQAAGESKEF